MSRLMRRFAVVALSLALCIVLLAACGGSSASTSQADVRAVARAEQALGAAWRQAWGRALKRCKGKSDEDAGRRCVGAVLVPREAAAEVRFSRVVRRVLDAGVGSECEKALEAALADMSSLPLFKGEAAIPCRKESRSK